jgi:hypothetical protein
MVVLSIARCLFFDEQHANDKNSTPFAKYRIHMISLGECYWRRGNRNSSVSVVISLRTSGKTRVVSLILSAKTVSGVRPASYTMGSRGLFPPGYSGHD